MRVDHNECNNEIQHILIPIALVPVLLVLPQRPCLMGDVGERLLLPESIIPFLAGERLLAGERIT